MNIAYLLTIGFLLPLAGFLTLVFFGRKIGAPKAGYLAAGLMIASAVIASYSAYNWVTMDTHHRIAPAIPIQWFTLGDTPVNVGIKVDSLTVIMFTMVTIVASCIFVYSIGYMHGDKRFPRFFTYLCLFGFSMLGLVLSDSLVGLFIFWELVGVCSYFLIGFWFEKHSASNAAKKAFIVNRIGDFLFLIGIAVMLGMTQSVSLDDVFSKVREGVFNGHSGLLTFAGICLFFGAVGKSAQFPLHVWLPDAMEGPTPVSALIHAATMVAAGVYLVGRIFPVLSPDALTFIAIIGTITLFGSALIAIVMTDIKRVLAYSTVSQLGYMILTLGIGGWVAGLFHLITHACFKALLFLGSGSVIHGCGGEQDVRKMGKLHKKMPVTSLTFLVGTLAIAGVPFFSGFYSKDAMIASMFANAWTRGSYQWVFFVLPSLAAAITAFYMMRVYLLTFHTTVKDEHIHHHAHESPKVMVIPLVLLAILSVGVGWFSQMPERKSLGNGEYAYHGGRGLVGLIAEAQPTWAVSWQMQEQQHHEESAQEARHQEHFFHKTATVVASGAMGGGFLLAFLTYLWPVISAERTAKRFSGLYQLLSNKFYVDEIYQATFVAGVMKLAHFGKWFDKTILDGIADGSARWVVRSAFFSGKTLDNRGVDGAVNGAASLALAGGQVARSGQNGRVRNYVLAALTVVAVVVLISLMMI